MASDKTKYTCIVTIHGIGFQQPPEEGVDGYADDLHAHLCAELNQSGNVLLSDDPDRRPFQEKRKSVPIYVRSVWPNESGTFRQEEGLMRLGTWMDHHRTVISHDRTQNPNQALVKENAPIAHIALVYSELEGEGPQPFAALEAGGEALIYASHYTNFKGLLNTVFRDTHPIPRSIWAKLKSIWKRAPEPPLTPSLRVRQDRGYRHHHHHIGTIRHPSGFTAIIRQLENDVAAYVCHNALRQRIRSFVLDALLRLAYRDDVSGIILNAHSNGTLIALDVVQELPPDAARQLRAIITAGSPIRKYIDLFEWGNHLAVRPTIDQWVEQWVNFYDERDIVADPLRPRVGWKQGTELTEKDLNGVYQTFNLASGRTGPILIVDKIVDNITNSSGGGLQAHNYWDNTKEFIPMIAEIVRNVHNNIPIQMEYAPLLYSSPARKKTLNGKEDLTGGVA